jgi:nitrogen fixation protein NifU and related proteins
VNDAVRQLYQAIIVEHGKSPRHRGPLPGATHEASVDNPLCGDRITLRLIVEGGAIRDAAYEAQGCTLSLAAASLLATRLAGAPLVDAAALVDRFAAFVGEPPGSPVPDLGDLAAFAGVREFRSRQACATLAAQAFLRAVADRRG